MGKGAKSFWWSFVLTLVVLAPLIWCVLIWSKQYRQPTQAAQSQATLQIQPGAQSHCCLLLAVAPTEALPEPGFVLLRLDGPLRRAALCPLPGSTLLLLEGRTITLAESYLAAGPARAAQLLAQTLDCPQPEYLAATAEGWQALLGQAQARVDTSALLTPAQRTALALEEAVTPLDPLRTAQLLQSAQALPPSLALEPDAAQRLWAAVWDALLRQCPQALSGLGQAVRDNGGQILTSLSAVDLAALDALTAYLTGHPCTVESQTLPGRWSNGQLELDESSQALVQALLE